MDVEDAVYGCLIGAAIGDALGAPVEGWHRDDIRACHDKVDRLLTQPPALERPDGGAPGRVTDDTVLRHCLCLAFVRHGGRLTPEQYAGVLLERLDPARVFVTERIVLQKLRLGMSPWETGRGQPQADAATMAIAPVGIVHAADPAGAYRHAAVIAMVQQDGFERDAAATHAAGVAAAFAPDASADRVIVAMRAHSTYEVRRLLDLALGLAAEARGIDGFADAFYARLLDRSFPLPPDEEWEPDRSPAPTSREVLPAAAGILALTAGDPARALVEAASFGRDADTLATVVGGLTGALHGARSIPADWIDTVEAANRDALAQIDDEGEPSFRAMAGKLVGALNAEHAAAARRADELTSLLAADHGR